MTSRSELERHLNFNRYADRKPFLESTPTRESTPTKHRDIDVSLPEASGHPWDAVKRKKNCLLVLSSAALAAIVVASVLGTAPLETVFFDGDEDGSECDEDLETESEPDFSTAKPFTGTGTKDQATDVEEYINRVLDTALEKTHDKMKKDSFLRIESLARPPSKNFDLRNVELIGLGGLRRIGTSVHDPTSKPPEVYVMLQMTDVTIKAQQWYTFFRFNLKWLKPRYPSYVFKKWRTFSCFFPGISMKVIIYLPISWEDGLSFKSVEAYPRPSRDCAGLRNIDEELREPIRQFIKELAARYVEQYMLLKYEPYLYEATQQIRRDKEPGKMWS